MKNKFYYSCRKKTMLLVAMFWAMSTAINALGYVQDFESITKANPIPSDWGRIQDGNMTYSRETEKTHGYSSWYSLKCGRQVTTRDMLVTPVLSGTVKVWIRGNGNDQECSMRAYACTEENGNYVVGDEIDGSYWTSSKSDWIEASFTVGKATHIALWINGFYIDDFSADNANGTDPGEEHPQERKALQLTAFDCLTESPVTADENNCFTALFAVTVKNSGNVDLEAKEVSLSLTKELPSAYTTTEPELWTTATADAPLLAGESRTLSISITAPAAEGGTFYFYAKENLNNTYYNNGAYGSGHSITVEAYLPQFRIAEEGSYSALFDDEVIHYGYTTEEVSKRFVITNNGTAPLQVKSIEVPEGFKVSENAFTVEAGGSTTFAVAIVPEENHYGAKSGQVAISHSLGNYSFSIDGRTVDPTLFFENFESATFADDWQVGEKWSISATSDNHYAQQNDMSGEATMLVTPLLNVKRNQTLSFQAKRTYPTTEATLRVLMSQDRENWSEIGNYGQLISREYSGNSFLTIELKDIPIGKGYLAFEGNQVAIDNVLGFTLVGEEPILMVSDESGKMISSNTTLSLGEIEADKTVTYTISNVGTGTLEVAIETANGLVALSEAKMSLAAGQSSQLTITMPLEPWGEKTDVVTITQPEVKTVTITLSATSTDPAIAAAIASTNTQHTNNKQFTLGGQPANGNTKGIILTNKKKIIRN